ncbi:MAG: cysteine peptidase family C39 domain-containing protein [Xenococcus sp. MO_188.B8]|nr:cysteine peptidase family C39 domain-containing protein [Xenococcus sp. MO_188.B8]
MVLQHSEKDCGVVCFANIGKHYGYTFAIS